VEKVLAEKPHATPKAISKARNEAGLGRTAIYEIARELRPGRSG